MLQYVYITKIFIICYPINENFYLLLESINWNNFDEERCFGISKSLYEKNPMTGINAGNPIADVFGIIARDNNVIMALADGVNWGEGSRLAARCAIRGTMDHLNNRLFTEQCKTTTVSIQWIC